MEVIELVTKINQARHDYYNGQSTVSDRVYDTWIDELSLLDPKNPAVIGIGAEPVSNWEKYTHKVELGSLNKVQTEEEFKKWYDKYIKQDDCLFTLKLDGLSVALIYENGVLINGSLRGSGVTGENILSNIIKMGGVPLRLNKKLNMTVRGEILLSKQNHKDYFSTYSNPRNAASGISRRFDGEGSDKLDIISYQIMSDELQFSTYAEQFDCLKELGFAVPPYEIASYDKVIELKNQYASKLRDDYPFLLDGLVIHANNMSTHLSYGSHNMRPYASIAYKFDSLAKEANVSDIVVQVGNSGRLTPVAVFNPKVDLLGAEVERASLHNFSNIAELGVDIGAKVLICRSNDVIPYVEEVSQSTGTIFQKPTNCPECNSKVVETGEYLQCPNSDCPAQVVGRIKNWIKELNILEWGNVLIEKLVASKKVKSVADLYCVTTEELSSLDRMGKRSAQKCYDFLWSNVEITLDIFLGSLSIPMIGSSTIRMIMDKGYDSLEKIMKLNVSNLENIPGIGPVKAKALIEGLNHNQDLIEELLENGVKIKEKTEGNLTGKKIAITGSTNIKRAELERMIQDNGGEYKSSVGKNCTHLIIADVNSTSTKAVAARKLGIVLISEDQFLNMI